MEPIDRVLRDLDDPSLADKLAAVPGADLTTLLLDVMRRRAHDISPADVMRQRSNDRFVSPSPVELAALHETEAQMLTAVPENFATVVLSPVTPLGLHAKVADVDQNRLISTIRRTDVAGDPTAGLALEAALRRRELLAGDSKSSQQVDLATIQRVVRAQTFEGSMSWAHFTILGLVSAARARAGLDFEVECLADHAAVLAGCLLAAGADHVTVTVADWTDGRLDAAPGLIAAELAGMPVTILEDPDRERARGYYLEGAFEIDARFGGTTFSAADGGLVDWTQQLVGSRKERLMISGIGVDRVALAREERDSPQPDLDSGPSGLKPEA